MRADIKPGDRYGMLTVKEYAGIDKWNNRAWLCKCDCGREKILSSHALTKRGVKSCGCYRSLKMKKANPMRTHGGSYSRLYQVWKDIISRCECKTDKRFHLYGGRGISVCHEWHDFRLFRDWADSSGYDENAVRGECTIDRVDNGKDYCPENCRWVDMKTQSNNKRNNHKITIDGETHTISEWSDISGIKYGTISERLRRGFSERDAVWKEVRNGKCC